MEGAGHENWDVKSQVGHRSMSGLLEAGECNTTCQCAEPPPFSYIFWRVTLTGCYI